MDNAFVCGCRELIFIGIGQCLRSKSKMKCRQQFGTFCFVLLTCPRKKGVLARPKIMDRWLFLRSGSDRAFGIGIYVRRRNRMDGTHTDRFSRRGGRREVEAGTQPALKRTIGARSSSRAPKVVFACPGEVCAEELQRGQASASVISQ